MDQVFSGLFLPQDLMRYSSAFEAVIQTQLQNLFTVFRRSELHWRTWKRCKITKLLKLAYENCLSSVEKKRVAKHLFCSIARKSLKCRILSFSSPFLLLFSRTASQDGRCSWQRVTHQPPLLLKFLAQPLHHHFPPVQNWCFSSTCIIFTYIFFPLNSQAQWANNLRPNFACNGTHASLGISIYVVGLNLTITRLILRNVAYLYSWKELGHEVVAQELLYT